MRLFGEGIWNQHCTAATASTYVDGGLSARDRQRVDRHLSTCDGCARRVSDVQSVVVMLRELPTMPAPRSFAVPAPARAYAAAPSRPWWQPAPLAGLRMAAAGAAMALALVFAGDLSGAVGTADVPVVVGITEATDFVTSGNPPGPERSELLGPASAATGAAAPLVDVTAPETSPAASSLPTSTGPRLELWALELGLLALAVALGALALVTTRRRAVGA